MFRLLYADTLKETYDAFLGIQYDVGSWACQISWTFKKLKDHTYSSSFFTKKSLLLERLTIYSGFNSMPLWHHTVSACHPLFMEHKN